MQNWITNYSFCMAGALVSYLVDILRGRRSFKIREFTLTMLFVGVMGPVTMFLLTKGINFLCR
jgi:hypothetical protein